MRGAWRAMAAVGVILGSVAIFLSVWLFVLNGERVDQINQERVRNTVTSCVRDSNANLQIIEFLRDAGAQAETIDRAERFFPVLTQDECERRARETIRK